MSTIPAFFSYILNLVLWNDSVDLSSKTVRSVSYSLDFKVVIEILLVLHLKKKISTVHQSTSASIVSNVKY